MKFLSFIKHIFNKETIDNLKINDINKLIENKTEEFLNLDYEEIPKIPSYDGLAEHISGFLNSSGGIVIFGLSERTEKKRNIPYKITWSHVKKETLENNLYQKIDPWNKEIKIKPIANPENSEERIFVIFVPKSKTPPHMANKRYYIRINFRTDAIGHDHVKRLFNQYYLQKQDLFNKVYGPLFNELSEYHRFKEIRNLPINEIHNIRSDNKYLLFFNDYELYEELDIFYDSIRNWNNKNKIIPAHIAKLITEFSEVYFKKKLYSQLNQSGIKIEVEAVSKQETMFIDQAIINGKDPFKFWKKKNPHIQLIETKMAIEVATSEIRRDYKTKIISEEKAKDFISKLLEKIAEDKIIRDIRKEFKNIHNHAKRIIELLIDRN